MDIIKLVFPNRKYEQNALEFIHEFLQYKSKINGSGGLDSYINNYDGWLEKIKNDLDYENIKPSRVLANTFFAIRMNDNKIIGMINIRHKLNDYLLKNSGHIGYCVRPTERLKGYATIMLKLGIIKCDELNIKNVLVTCDKKNIGSAKTIQKNGGILENEITDSNLAEVVQRYWINVKDNIK
jgi:predicted acetyltransferase